jgi:hypothetical protein
MGTQCGINFSHFHTRIEASEPPLQFFLMNFDSILRHYDCYFHVTRRAGFPGHLRRGFPLWSTLAFDTATHHSGNTKRISGRRSRTCIGCSRSRYSITWRSSHACIIVPRNTSGIDLARKEGPSILSSLPRMKTIVIPPKNFLHFFNTLNFIKHTSSPQTKPPVHHACRHSGTGKPVCLTRARNVANKIVYRQSPARSE